MEVQKSIREFKYNGVALPDPGAQFSLEQVREFYSALYPEIVNAAIEGPTNVGNKIVYEFRRAVGTKGADSRRESLVHVEAFMARQRGQASVSPPKRLRRFHASVALSLTRTPFDGMQIQEPALPRSSALPLLP